MPEASDEYTLTVIKGILPRPKEPAIEANCFFLSQLTFSERSIYSFPVNNLSTTQKGCHHNNLDKGGRRHLPSAVSEAGLLILQQRFILRFKLRVAITSLSDSIRPHSRHVGRIHLAVSILDSSQKRLNPPRM
jgi:hypothetical protein